MSPVDLTFAVLAFSSLLAVVNPLSAATIFLALTGDHTPERRRKAAWKGSLTAFLVLGIFALSGGALLGFFGITTEAFRITGGIILFAIGWDMLQARRSRVKVTEEEEKEPREDVGVIPLGLPTIAGPGAITTVIVLTAQAEDVVGHLVVHGAIAAVVLLTAGAMLVAPLLLHTFGRTGLNVMTRIMGLLVMVIGVQFVLDGLPWN
ncbi:MAG: MarC family protein [Gemmatimonadota bacterium]